MIAVKKRSVRLDGGGSLQIGPAFVEEPLFDFRQSQSEPAIADPTVDPHALFDRLGRFGHPIRRGEQEAALRVRLRMAGNKRRPAVEQPRCFPSPPAEEFRLRLSHPRMAGLWRACAGVGSRCEGTLEIAPL